MNYALIKDGIVENVIVANEGYENPDFTVVQSDTAKIGDTYAEGVFTTPVEPISDELKATMRRQAYTEIADPVYFKWQAGEATQQEWLDARQTVKDMVF